MSKSRGTFWVHGVVPVHGVRRQGKPVRYAQRSPACRQGAGASQISHRSVEAGNDREAKGGLEGEGQWMPRRAARLPARGRRPCHGEWTRRPRGRGGHAVSGFRGHAGRLEGGARNARAFLGEAMGQLVSLAQGWVGRSRRCGDSPTGEPDAGDPPVRFGGRVGAHAPSLPQSLGGVLSRRRGGRDGRLPLPAPRSGVGRARGTR